MKKTIRRGVFETNSSSNHTLSLYGNEVDVNGDYEIIIKGSYFDQFSFGVYDVEEKLEYLYALSRNINFHENDFKMYIKSIFPNIKLEIDPNARFRAGIDFECVDALSNDDLSWFDFLTKSYSIEISER